MLPKKRYILLQVAILVSTMYLSNALQCKTCEKNEAACLLGHATESQQCASDDDLCYSWFDRTITDVGAQRGCISPSTSEYKTIRKLIGDRENECVKRVNGLDCFKICSEDNCN